MAPCWDTDKMMVTDVIMLHVSPKTISLHGSGYLIMPSSLCSLHCTSLDASFALLPPPVSCSNQFLSSEHFGFLCFPGHFVGLFNRLITLDRYNIAACRVTAVRLSAHSQAMMFGMSCVALVGFVLRSLSLRDRSSVVCGEKTAETPNQRPPSWL